MSPLGVATDRAKGVLDAALLDLIAAQLPDVWWVASPDYRKFHYVSPAFERVWGDPVEDILADASIWSRRVHPDDLGLISALRSRRMSGDFSRPLSTEFRVIHRDGTLRWVQSRAKPLFDEGGKVCVVVGSVYDVTARRTAARQVGPSGGRSVRPKGPIDVVEGKEAVFLCNEELEVTGWSPEMSRLSGFEPDEILGTSIVRIFAVAGRPKRRLEVEQILEREGAYSMFARMSCKGGGERPVEVSLFAFGARSGRVDGVLHVVRDVRGDEGRLAVAHERQIRSLVRELAPEGFFCTDAEGCIVDVNQAYCRMVGWQIDELLGQNLKDLLEGCPGLPEPSDQVARTVDCRHVLAGGGMLDVQISFSGLALGGRRLFFLVRDVSARKRREAEKVRFMSGVLAAQEAERLRVGRQLRSSVGARLESLQDRLADLSRRFSEPERRRAAEALERSLRTLRREVEEVSLGFHSPRLDQLGLHTAVEVLAGSVGSLHDLEVGLSWRLERDVEASLRPEVRDHLYRVLQEALSNVVRHAAARRVTITLEQVDLGLTLRIVDDGVGFAPEGEPEQLGQSHGLGLIGMSQRADLLAASLEIRRAEGGGTAVELTVPLAEATGSLCRVVDRTADARLSRTPSSQSHDGR